VKRILLTGASGFIGKRYLLYNSSIYDLTSISLRETQVEQINFNGIDTIVHLAGMAHQMNKIDDQIYFDINHDLTLKLATAAKKAGVPHFIFISTVKVFGEETSTNKSFTESSICSPTDPYGKSKFLAEQGLTKLIDKDFAVAIVRPPLVYGPGVKGNMLRLLKLSIKGRTLPFGKIDNQRSMVFIDNLIELINSITNQKASGVYHAGDAQALSTSKLVSHINLHMDNNARLIKLNSFFLRILRWLKPGLVQRLWGSFLIDTQQTNKQLNFKPPYKSEEGIRQMVMWFKEQNSNT